MFYPLTIEGTCVCGSASRARAPRGARAARLSREVHALAARAGAGEDASPGSVAVRAADLSAVVGPGLAYKGAQVATMALMLRSGVSPYGDAMSLQYELPNCFQSGNPQPAFRKGEPAGLEFEFTGLKDPNAATEAESFGRLVIQHQQALP